MRAKRWCVLASLILVGSSVPTQSNAQESEPERGWPRSYMLLFLGFATETSRAAEDDETSFALALEYGRRVSQRWGIGGAVEWVSGEQAFREWLILAIAHWHLHNAWMLALGPGAEIARDGGDVELVLRLGISYKFLLPDDWALAPELNADFLTDDAIMLVYGLALKKEF